jgi:hypothetical protein
VSHWCSRAGHLFHKLRRGLVHIWSTLHREMRWMSAKQRQARNYSDLRRSSNQSGSRFTIFALTTQGPAVRTRHRPPSEAAPQCHSCGRLRGSSIPLHGAEIPRTSVRPPTGSQRGRSTALKRQLNNAQRKNGGRMQVWFPGGTERKGGDFAAVPSVCRQATKSDCSRFGWGGLETA